MSRPDWQLSWFSGFTCLEARSAQGLLLFWLRSGEPYPRSCIDRRKSRASYERRAPLFTLSANMSAPGVSTCPYKVFACHSGEQWVTAVGVPSVWENRNRDRRERLFSAIQKESFQKRLKLFSQVYPRLIILNENLIHWDRAVSWLMHTLVRSDQIRSASDIQRLHDQQC